MSMDNVTIEPDLDAIIDNGPDPTAPEAGSAPEGDGGAPAPVAPAAPPEPVAGEQPESFSREYVETLRREAGDRRVALKPFEDAFAGYEPDEIDTYLSLAKIIAKDPVAGAQYMHQIAEALERDNAPADPNAPVPVESVVDQRIRDYDEQRKAEDAERRQKEEADKIVQQVVGLGYQPNTAEFMTVLWHASNTTNGDIGKAHETVQAARQKVIDDYVASKSGAPAISPQGGEGVSLPEAPEDLTQAEDAVSRYIDSIS